MTGPQIVIPMAGRGQRFIDAGYDVPKPFITVKDDPMIDWVVCNLPSYRRIFFLVQRNQVEEFSSSLSGYRESTVVSIDGTTEGAACTVLLAREHLNMDEPLLVANSDQFLYWFPEHFLWYMEETQADGGIATFRASDPKWSFALVKEDGTILRVAEKLQISNDATCGVYYFREARMCFEAIGMMIEKDIRTNGEFYLCPAYNEMIQAGMTVRNYPVPGMIGMGTPEDLEKAETLLK